MYTSSSYQSPQKLRELARNEADEIARQQRQATYERAFGVGYSQQSSTQMQQQFQPYTPNQRYATGAPLPQYQSPPNQRHLQQSGHQSQQSLGRSPSVMDVRYNKSPSGPLLAPLHQQQLSPVGVQQQASPSHRQQYQTHQQMVSPQRQLNQSASMPSLGATASKYHLSPASNPDILPSLRAGGGTIEYSESLAGVRRAAANKTNDSTGVASIFQGPTASQSSKTKQHQPSQSTDFTNLPMASNDQQQQHQAFVDEYQQEQQLLDQSRPAVDDDETEEERLRREQEEQLQAQQDEASFASFQPTFIENGQQQPSPEYLLQSPQQPPPMSQSPSQSSFSHHGSSRSVGGEPFSTFYPHHSITPAVVPLPTSPVRVSALQHKKQISLAMQRQAHRLPTAGAPAHNRRPGEKGFHPDKNLSSEDILTHPGQTAEDAWFASTTQSAYDSKFDNFNPNTLPPSAPAVFSSETEHSANYRSHEQFLTPALTAEYVQRQKQQLDYKQRGEIHQTPNKYYPGSKMPDSWKQTNQHQPPATLAQYYPNASLAQTHAQQSASPTKFPTLSA